MNKVYIFFLFAMVNATNKNPVTANVILAMSSNDINTLKTSKKNLEQMKDKDVKQNLINYINKKLQLLETYYALMVSLNAKNGEKIGVIFNVINSIFTKDGLNGLLENKSSIIYSIEELSGEFVGICEAKKQLIDAYSTCYSLKIDGNLLLNIFIISEEEKLKEIFQKESKQLKKDQQKHLKNFIDSKIKLIQHNRNIFIISNKNNGELLVVLLNKINLLNKTNELEEFLKNEDKNINKLENKIKNALIEYVKAKKNFLEQ